MLHPMSTVPANIKDLPVSERIQLVEDIWDSIVEDAGPLPLSVEEREELDRRLAEHHANPSSSIPWDDIRASLFKGDA